MFVWWNWASFCSRSSTHQHAKHPSPTATWCLSAPSQQLVKCTRAHMQLTQGVSTKGCEASSKCAHLWKGLRSRWTFATLHAALLTFGCVQRTRLPVPLLRQATPMTVLAMMRLAPSPSTCHRPQHLTPDNWLHQACRRCLFLIRVPAQSPPGQLTISQVRRTLWTLVAWPHAAVLLFPGRLRCCQPLQLVTYQLPPPCRMGVWCLNSMTSATMYQSPAAAGVGKSFSCCRRSAALSCQAGWQRSWVPAARVRQR